MRKTLFAMLGLVALGLWALPAAALPTPGGFVADGPPQVLSDPVPLENRAGRIGTMARGGSFQGTLSGTLIRQTAVTTSWFLYPGACVARTLPLSNPNTWVPKLSPVADSLQNTAGFPLSTGYVDGQPNIAGGDNRIAYTRFDLSLSEILFHVVSSTTNVAQRPANSTFTGGSGNALWCGKFDPNGISTNSGKTIGYPNTTYQFLYVNTGTHAAPWSLTFDGTISVELNYDYVHFITAPTADPLQNRRDLLSEVIDTGHGSGATLQATFTGAMDAFPPGYTGIVPTGKVEGHAFNNPNTLGYSLSGIPASEIGLYIVMTSDCLYSSADGLWPNGDGQILDNMACSPGITLYANEPQAGGVDPFSGNIVKGTYGSAGFISCRVPAGVGELWQLAPGTENVTADICSPQKAFSTDLFFEGGDPTTNLQINKQFNAVTTCTMPVPVGTASILALWTTYFDLPRFAGYVQDTEYRFYKGGGWTEWQDTAGGIGSVNLGATQAWTLQGDELGEAVQADSLQLRYVIRCIAPFAADGLNCSGSQTNGLLYDNFRLEVVTGVPAPLFSIFPGAVAQSTFVDGTMKGTNCQSVAPCWPGNRGSDLGTQAQHNTAIHDNFNQALGDTITLAVVTGLRKNGMGVNWKRATSKGFQAGEEIRYTNASFPARYPPLLPNGQPNPRAGQPVDFPRMIFRLYDPATTRWSPFDSTELIADANVGVDTVVINSSYAVNWPPRDKVETNALLPPANATGWPGSINGVNNYAGLAFLPRGTRMQYYFKGTDINGGESYQFSTDLLANEVEDLPTLPGSSLIAPDIIEFDVLPRVYPPGPAGSLLAGRTDADVLNLDGYHQVWTYDPVTQALRALGVRADRYRTIQSGTSANSIGGRELPGQRIDRFSNFVPNLTEYAIIDSLAIWYRIMIESSHTSTSTTLNEQDATVVEQWWRKDTGQDQGDRCVFISGDDAMNNLLNTTGIDLTFEISLAQQVFGVTSVTHAWTGTNTTAYPTIDDRFAAPGAGPGLAAQNSFTIPVDGGCPGPNKFDALVAVADPDVVSAAFYPNGQVAAIGRSRELDNTGDKDRQKSLAYGFSIQLIRQPNYGTTNANYARSGVENRMRVLYKFLTSCRGMRVADGVDIGICWPCPTPGGSSSTLATMQGDWASQSANPATGFVTGTYGPLYGIQAGALATAVDDPTSAAPRINKIYGNFPNPFNPHTAIRFSSAVAGKAQIRIFSVSGRLVRTLNTNVAEGPNEVRWNGKADDGAPLASGVYFYKLVSSNGEVVRGLNSLVLVK